MNNSGFHLHCSAGESTNQETPWTSFTEQMTSQLYQHGKNIQKHP